MRLSEEGRLTELPDVGDTIAAKVTELRETGSLAALEKLEAKYPPGLVEIMHLPGVGAKTTRKLFDALGVTTVDELRVACETERVRDVAGLGAKAEEKILAAIAAGGGPRKGAILLDRALARSEELLAGIRAHPACVAASEAGSLRRRRETVGDIDLIAASDDPPALLQAFCAPRRPSPRRRPAATRRRRSSTHDGDPGRPPRRAAGLVRQPPAALHGLEGAQRRDARGGRAARPVDLGVGHPRGRDAASRTGWPTRTRCTRSSATRRSRPRCARTRGELQLARDGRVPAPRRARRHPRRPPLAHHRLRRARVDRRDGGRGDGARLRVPRDHRPLARRRHGHRPRAGASASPTPSGSASTRPRCPTRFHLLAGVEVDVMTRRDARVSRTTCWRRSTGSSRRCTSTSASTATGMTARLRGGGHRSPHVDVIGHPSGRQLGDARAVRLRPRGA